MDREREFGASDSARRAKMGEDGRSRCRDGRLKSLHRCNNHTKSAFAPPSRTTGIPAFLEPGCARPASPPPRPGRGEGRSRDRPARRGTVSSPIPDRRCASGERRKSRRGRRGSGGRRGLHGVLRSLRSLCVTSAVPGRMHKPIRQVVSRAGEAHGVREAFRRCCRGFQPPGEVGERQTSSTRKGPLPRRGKGPLLTPQHSALSTSVLGTGY